MSEKNIFIHTPRVVKMQPYFYIAYDENKKTNLSRYWRRPAHRNI